MPRAVDVVVWCADKADAEVSKTVRNELTGPRPVAISGHSGELGCQRTMEDRVVMECHSAVTRRAGLRHSAAIVIAVIVAVIVAPAVAGDAGSSVQVSVLKNTPEAVVIQYELGDFVTKPVTIDGEQYVRIYLGKESIIKQRGAPAVPSVNRSIVIPRDAEIAVNVLASEYYDVADIAVVPDKGYISRATNPADVPYTFGDVYETDAFYPAELITPHQPYVMRDERGVLIQLNPFQYNTVSRTLRVYTDVTLEVVKVGPGKVNVLAEGLGRKTSASFEGIYRNHFVNYVPNEGGSPRYDPMGEEGDMLIICYDSWMTNMQPFVDHKNSIGINTTIVGVSTVGNNPTSIKNYIQGVYNGGNLAFVLLVGDGAEVATPMAGLNYNDGSSDPSYAKLSGSDDWPDIIIGRFSAQSEGDVDTQVERTIEYENMPASQQGWYWRGTGVASNQGTGDDGEDDDEHLDNIRQYQLLPSGYTEVDQIYDDSGTASQVTSAMNAGRGIANYCGHGSATRWSSTGFSSSHVNSLTNDNMLPFICSVACLNGNFDGNTCFAEAWLRATHDGEPTGAIATYMSSNNQPWDPPMEGQDEFNILLVDPAEPYSTFGGLCFAASCSMMEDYPGSDQSWGTGPATYNTWHIFGDPSLRVIGADPQYVDCDGDGGPPDMDDVTAMILALLDPAEYAIQHAGGDADLDDSGAADGLDIQLLVDALMTH